MDNNGGMLIIYNKKNQDVTIPICKMFQELPMVHKLITRELILDTLGKYTMLYSIDTDIEDIITQLRIEIHGEEISKKLDNHYIEPTPDSYQ